MTTTKTSRAEELRERYEQEIEKLNAESAILELLPDGIKTPTVSNIRADKEIHAWLSFHPEYQDDKKAFALGALSALERAGAEPLPISLCKWADYRPSASPGLTDSIPDTRRGCFGSTDKPTWAEPVAPLYVIPNQFTGCELRTFYRLGGKTFQVNVKMPDVAHVQCRRVEYRGGWRFEGSASLHFPDAWHSINLATGECVALMSQHTRGFRDTEQGISGHIFWMPTVEQAEFPLSPAQLLSILLSNTP